MDGVVFVLRQRSNVNDHVTSHKHVIYKSKGVTSEMVLVGARGATFPAALFITPAPHDRMNMTAYRIPAEHSIKLTRQLPQFFLSHVPYRRRQSILLLTLLFAAENIRTITR
jgi:hypothetical protein